MKWLIHSYHILLIWVIGSPDFSILSNELTSNIIEENSKDESGLPSCCNCDYTDLFTRFIDALGNDDLIKKYQFRGLPGTEGPPGPHGPEGFQGRPGQKGDIGAIGPSGERGLRGERGQLGKKGDKGERGETVMVYRQHLGESERAIEVKGQKGDVGKRGTKGDRGLPGLTVVGQKGEPGPPGEFNWETKENLKGEKGDRGNPGRLLNCQHCYRSRGKVKPQSLTNPQDRAEIEKLYVPVQGPPGKSIIGEPGPKGEPGVPGIATKNSVIILSYENELSQIFDQHSIGTLAYVRASETLFLQMERGWKEITFTGRHVDPYVHRRRHEKREHKFL